MLSHLTDLEVSVLNESGQNLVNYADVANSGQMMCIVFINIFLNV